MITAPPRGNTKTAAYIDKTASAYFENSATLGKQAAYSELTNFWQECKLPDWDGYDALPVQEKTFWNAYRFIQALPLGYPLPSIGAEPDGDLTLEWYRDPHWTLSVSISPESILYYAALFGDNDPRGSERFFGNIPRSILNLIKKVKGV